MQNYRDQKNLTFDEVLDDTQQEIRNYSTGFVYQDRPLGSGTLVRWGDNFGILTAAHVTRELDFNSMEKLRIPLVGCGHSFGIPCCHLEEVANFYKYGGPDISLIKLPVSSFLDTLNAVKSFYNLTMRKEKKLRHSLGNTGLFLISGGPAGLSTYKLPDHGFTKLVNSPSMRFQAIIKRRFTKKSFDYVEVESDLKIVGVDYLNGVSGGGLWRVLVSKGTKPDRHNYLGTVLCGVVFYQKGLRSDGTRRVICQGSKTIYRRILRSRSV
jgi:hypothetical protein